MAPPRLRHPRLDQRAQGLPHAAASPDSEGGGRRSSVPGFDRTLRHFFPEVEEDPDNAIDLAERLLLLKRRLDEKTAGFEWEPERQRPSQEEGFLAVQTSIDAGYEAANFVDICSGAYQTASPKALDLLRMSLG